MNKAFYEKWKYFLREIAIVVVGVLLAFILNSWWMNVREATSNRILLSSLEKEMRSNQEQLQETKKIHEFVLRNALELASLLHETDPGQTAIIPDTILAGSMIAATFNPSSGIIESFLASTEKGAIGKNELVALVASWRYLYEDVVEDELTGFALIENQFIPFLRSRVDLSMVLSDMGWWARYARTGNIHEKIEPAFLQQSQPILPGFEIRNLVAQRKMRLGITISGMSRLERLQEQILELIKKQR